MGFIAAIEAEKRANAYQGGHPKDPAIANLFGGFSTVNSGVTVTSESAMRVTVVYRAVSLLAQTYASLPLTVDRFIDGGVEEDRNHPLYDLIVFQPNKWQTSFEWREMMAGHFALRGRCYSEIISTGGRSIDQLIPLHPDRVRPFRAPDGKIAFYYQDPVTNRSRVILQDEMHWMHLMSSDGLDWKSPIQICREAVGLSLATEEHAARLFANGTRTTGFLKMSGHFKDDTAQKNFVKSWQEAQAGLKNTGKVIVLENGMEWQQVGMTSEDAQFIQLREFQLSEIGPRIFGVPAHKLGDLSRSTNNNIEHQGIEFVTDTIRPGCVRWEQSMQRDLFAGKRTHRVTFDLDGLMRGDSAARAQFNASALQNGYKSRNEIRREEGYNTSDAPGMNDYTVQSNMIKVGDMGKFLENKQPKQTEQQS